MRNWLGNAKLKTILVATSGICGIAQVVGAASLEDSLPALQAIGKRGDGHVEAVAAWKTVAAAPAHQLPLILAAMRDDNPLANNWFRAAVDTIASRTLKAGDTLPLDALETYLADTDHSSRSRRLAFEWVTHVDPTARARWIPKLLNDPSLELRREAVEVELQRGVTAQDVGQRDEAIGAFTRGLTHARDIDQIKAAYEALRKLEHPVDLPKHFGFVMNWHLIGPMDNTDTSGFDRVFPPEEEIDLEAEYAGKEQVVRWKAATSEDDYGTVDLNKLIGKHMGATAYALAFFDADQAGPAELRLGCINANKIWLNGKLLTANHVYHAGNSIDQYVGHAQLKAGRNTILLKICQNQQTESWAQDWAFQLRVCDALGTAILPAGL